MIAEFADERVGKQAGTGQPFVESDVASWP